MHRRHNIQSFLCSLFAAFAIILSPAESGAQESQAVFDAPLVVTGAFNAIRHVVDLDGDSYPDAIGLWSFNGHDTKVQTWVNDGTGKLREHWNTTIEHQNFGGTEPFAVGDLDGDGTDDFGIAVNKTVLLYTGNGHGSFTPWRQWDDANIIGDLYIDDFNGDGMGDPVIRTSYVIKLHLSQGPGQPYLVRQQGTSYSSSRRIMSAEMNGDGLPDILIRYTGGVEIYPITNGVIGVGESFTHSSAEVAAGDIDGDGDDDLVLFSSYGNYKLVRRTGPQTFVEEAIKTGGPATHLFDVNGDGALDGVCCGGGGSTRYNDDPSDFVVAINLGGGNFDSAFKIPGLGSRRLAGVADMDLDGDVDLIAGRCVYYARGPIRKDPSPSFGSVVSGNDAVVDCDGDGDPDLEFGLSSVMTNNGAGEVVSSVPYVMDPPAVGTLMGPGMAGDFNGDGTPDLLVEYWQQGSFSTMQLLENVGGGNLVDGGDASAGRQLSDPSRTDSALALDVDGDGDLDLFGIVPGTVGGRLWLNDGSGSFEPDFFLEDDELVLAAALFDQDAHLDLLVQLPAEVGIRRSLGDGTYSPFETVFGYSSVDPSPLVADPDGNGTQDILGFVSIHAARFYANDGAGSFQEDTTFLPSAVGASTTYERRIFFEDVNSDGLEDLVMTPAKYVQNGASIRLRTGPGFEYAPTVQQTMRGTALADADGDGDLDFIRDRIVFNRQFDGPTAGEREQYGPGLAGTGGVTPVLGAVGPFRPGSSMEVRLVGGRGGARAFLLVGNEEAANPVRGGLVLTNNIKVIEVTLDGNPGEAGVGSFSLVHPSLPATRANSTFYVQGFVSDPEAVERFAFTQGLRLYLGGLE